MKLKVKSNKFYYYLFLWFISLLSGNYLGRNFYIIYVIIRSVLVTNILHFILTINKIYYNQNFSTTHPQKGDLIEYNLKIENKLPFIPCLIDIDFTDSLSLKSFRPILKNKSSITLNKQFSLPYRGIYNAGIESIVCRDILGLLEYKFNYWPKTFYVYPKIDEKMSINRSIDGKSLNKKYNKISDNNDYFQKLDNFRIGDKLSLISWKHLLVKNNLYKKVFLTEDGFNSYIFLDKTRLPHYREGPADDKAIEITLSLIFSYIDNRVSVLYNNYQGDVSTYKDYNRCYKDSIKIDFNKTQKQTLLEYKSINIEKMANLILVTPLESNFFLNSDIINRHKNLTIFIITTGMKKEREVKLNKLKERYKNVDFICVN